MAEDRVVLLTCEAGYGQISARALAAAFPSLAVIVEEPVSRLALLRRRMRRLGIVRVFGQLVFMAWLRIQARLAQVRIAEIKRKIGPQGEWPSGVELVHVSSVNAPECIDALRRLTPVVVLVVGTRLIEPAVLGCIDAPFINYHAGITPKYRGVHGGYWALAEGDAAHCGVTVHLVDTGIDTGAVLYQDNIAPTRADNFSTYSYLQLAAALPLLERSARDAIERKLAPRRVELPSHLWYHPTIWRYVATGLRRGVW